MEGWLHKVFERLKRLAEENTADLYSSGYIDGYKKLLRQMDSNRDGVLSESEVWQFLHKRQPHILNQVHRFVVKHHSEWLRDGLSELWRTALAEQAEVHPERALYNQRFIDALVWMKDVPEINSGEALWHMHPVVFLNSLKRELKVTKEMLRKIWIDPVRVSDEILNVIADELTFAFYICNINTSYRLNHFMAQVFQEVGPSLNLNENFNYRSNVLVAKFLYYRSRRFEADEDGYIPGQRPANSLSIANKVYANRGGNGGYESGDGWRFRGRGMKQLTFRGNYRSFTTYHEMRWNSRIDFEAEPDILLQITYAVRSALYFWGFNRLYLLADRGTSREVSDSITTVVNIYDDHYEVRFNNLNQLLREGVFDEVF